MGYRTVQDLDTSYDCGKSYHKKKVATYCIVNQTVRLEVQIDPKSRETLSGMAVYNPHPSPAS